MNRSSTLAAVGFGLCFRHDPPPVRQIPGARRQANRRPVRAHHRRLAMEGRSPPSPVPQGPRRRNRSGSICRPCTRCLGGRLHQDADQSRRHSRQDPASPTKRSSGRHAGGPAADLGHAAAQGFQIQNCPTTPRAPPRPAGRELPSRARQSKRPSRICARRVHEGVGASSRPSGRRRPTAPRTAKWSADLPARGRRGEDMPSFNRSLPNFWFPYHGLTSLRSNSVPIGKRDFTG